jgi:catechol 2,3-dioxygenase-like lactoylglutathione lyase family enzyme
MPTNLGNRVLPCFLVSNMRRSLEFYIERLGFTQTAYYPIESDPIRAEVRRDGVAIVLFSDPRRIEVEKPMMSGGIYIFPESVDKLSDELRGKVPFISEPRNTELDLREFAIRDPDGYMLVFAERVH